MKHLDRILIGVLFLIMAAFFYKFVILGRIPFPGDLLIAEYNPWKSYTYLGFNPGSYPHKAQYFDTLRQIYPWKTISIEAIPNGIMPLWNPYNFSGHPLFANFQSAVLYPLNLLFLVFSQKIAWSLLVILQPLLASVFMYLFMRRIGVKQYGSLLAGISYGSCLYMSTFLEYNTIGHTIAFLPLILYSLDGMFQKTKTWDIILFFAAIFFSFTSGHIQIFGFVMFFTITYAFFRIKSISKTTDGLLKNSFSLIVLIIIALGIGAIQLFPTLELIQLSARSPQSYEFLLKTLLLQPYQLVLLISPDIFGNPVTRNYLISDTYPGNAIYIGLIPLIVSVFALSQWKKNFHVKFFSISILVLLLLLTNNFLSKLFYQIQIPFFSSGSPTNANFLISFALAVLAGFGLEALTSVKRKKINLVLVSFGIVILGLWVLFGMDQTRFIRNSLVFSTGLFAIFTALLIIVQKNRTLKHGVIIALIMLTIFDLFYFFQKFNPFVPSSLVFPQTEVFSYLQKNAGINRFWSIGDKALEPNVQSQFQLFSSEGYDPLYPRWYGEFLLSTVDGKIHDSFNTRTRSDAVIAPVSNPQELTEDFNKTRILELLGTKYLTVNSISYIPEKYKSVYEKGGWKILEDKNAYPRAFLADSYQVYTTNSQFEQFFFNKSFDPRNTLLLEEPISDFKENGTGTASLKKPDVKIVSYEPNTVTIIVESNNEKLLFLSDTYFPGWNAYVNEREVKIYKAHFAFRAVRIPEGKSIVRFEYKPSSFILGAKATIISLILAIGSLIYYRKRAVFS